MLITTTFKFRQFIHLTNIPESLPYAQGTMNMVMLVLFLLMAFVSLIIILTTIFAERYHAETNVIVL